MRHLFLLLLLCLLSLPALADDEEYPMPTLPDEPIMLNAWASFYAQTYQFAWLDNETLVFTPYDKWYSMPEDSPYETYSYNLAEGSLSLLERPLFRENWNEEWRNYFGFDWQEHDNWQQAFWDYRSWLRTGNKRFLELSCSYQRDDVLSMLVVWKKMLEMA